MRPNTLVKPKTLLINSQAQLHFERDPRLPCRSGHSLKPQKYESIVKKTEWILYILTYLKIADVNLS